MHTILHKVIPFLPLLTKTRSGTPGQSDSTATHEGDYRQRDVLSLRTRPIFLLLLFKKIIIILSFSPSVPCFRLLPFKVGLPRTAAKEPSRAEGEPPDYVDTSVIIGWRLDLMRNRKGDERTWPRVWKQRADNVGSCKVERIPRADTYHLKRWFRQALSSSAEPDEILLLWILMTDVIMWTKFFGMLTHVF